MAKITKKTKNKSKRIVVISDTHCGHITGLTPPEWHMSTNNKSSSFFQKKNLYAKLQREMWKWYVDVLKSLQPIDILFTLGDLIDGRGEASGGTELITTDCNEQCEIAIECLKPVNAKEVAMVYGTPYHTGKRTDYEDVIAKEFNATIDDHLFVNVNGTVFDLRHKVGNSSVPYGRSNQISRQKLHNIVWADKDLQPNSDVILRGHVHCDTFVGDHSWLGMTVPGLQWYSKYGCRQCDNIVNIGLTYFDVDGKGGYTWGQEIAKLGEQKAQVLKL
jgi:predicted MPP superfamily phosphohydrolase